MHGGETDLQQSFAMLGVPKPVETADRDERQQAVDEIRRTCRHIEDAKHTLHRNLAEVRAGGLSEPETRQAVVEMYETHLPVIAALQEHITTTSARLSREAGGFAVAHTIESETGEQIDALCVVRACYYDVQHAQDERYSGKMLIAQVLNKPNVIPHDNPEALDYIHQPANTGLVTAHVVRFSPDDIVI